MNIVNVEMETAGAGIDDSEITITYLEKCLSKATMSILMLINLNSLKNGYHSTLHLFIRISLSQSLEN